MCVFFPIRGISILGSFQSKEQCVCERERNWCTLKIILWIFFTSLERMIPQYMWRSCFLVRKLMAGLPSWRDLKTIAPQGIMLLLRETGYSLVVKPKHDNFYMWMSGMERIHYHFQPAIKMYSVMIRRVCNGMVAKRQNTCVKYYPWARSVFSIWQL